jgi:hypothetical protein
MQYPQWLHQSHQLLLANGFEPKIDYIKGLIQDQPFEVYRVHRPDFMKSEIMFLSWHNFNDGQHDEIFPF